MLGQDVNTNHSARRKAQKQISSARFVFSTCVGAGLGLLRAESFDTVIIDEASQQAEPASLVPLVKGCKRAILVGDHVQLRATVRPNAATQGHDISLFERLWVEDSGKYESAVQKVMLNTQYRMHPKLCAFPSAQFYEDKLLTAARCESIPAPAGGSSFDWPQDGKRSVFIQCDAREDVGSRSKCNDVQAKLCQDAIRRLTTPRETPASSSSPPLPSEPVKAQPQADSNLVERPSIAILTPYTRQLERLRCYIPDPEIKISTIDAFKAKRLISSST